MTKKVTRIKYQDEFGTERTRKRVQTVNTLPTMTEKHHTESCDIRHIMRKAEKTGLISHINHMEGRYMDLASRPDYEQALQIIAQGKSAFETVPATIRKQFNNDPAQFTEFMQTPENREAIQALGLPTDHLPRAPEPPEPIPFPIRETPPVSPETPAQPPNA